MALTRKAFLVAFAATTLLLMSSCHSKLDALGVDLNVDEEKLSNGLRVMLIENHTMPVVAYQTWYRVGSVDEKPGMTGISHFFEHLMFKGTEKYGPKEFFNQLEAHGAEVNAFTTRDYTVYHEDFTPDLLEKVIDMESDRMEHLKLTPEVLKTERQVVLEERRMRNDNSPSGKIQEALWAEAFQIHPYHWPVIGYPEDLMRLKVSDLISWYRAHYQPRNATIVIAGDIDPDRTMQLIRKYYGPIEGRPVPARVIPKEPEQNGERRVTLHDDVASERFAQAYHIPAADEDDTYALDVLSNILFEGTSSRAYRYLVEKKNIATGVNGSSFTPTYPGLFIITGMMREGHQTAEAERALDHVIREVQDHGVTQGEINAAVKQLTVQVVDSISTDHGMAQLVGTIVTVLGHPRPIEKDLQKYLKVTAKDVQRVANKYLLPNNRSIVILAPKSRSEVAAKPALRPAALRKEAK